MIVRALVFAFLAIAAAAFPAAADDTCPTTQTSGSGEKLFATCVTETGNVEKFITPAGVDNLVIDSYMICDSESGGVFTARAYSRGSPFLEDNFADPTTHTATSNVRKTEDGRYTLTQSYMRDATERELIITMTLRNNGPGSVTEVVLQRVADIHAGGGFANVFFHGRDSIAAVNTANGRGMMMGVLTPEVLHVMSVQTFSAFVNDFFDTCHYQPAGFVPPEGDYVGVAQFHLGNIAAGAAKTVKLVYRRF